MPHSIYSSGNSSEITTDSQPSVNMRMYSGNARRDWAGPLALILAKCTDTIVEQFLQRVFFLIFLKLFTLRGEFHDVAQRMVS